jgi:hypothetical protein
MKRKQSDRPVSREICDKRGLQKLAARPCWFWTLAAYIIGLLPRSLLQKMVAEPARFLRGLALSVHHGKPVWRQTIQPRGEET